MGEYYWGIKALLNCGQKLSGAVPSLSVVGQPNSLGPFIGKEWTLGMLWPCFLRWWKMAIKREREKRRLVWDQHSVSLLWGCVISWRRLWGCLEWTVFLWDCSRCISRRSSFYPALTCQPESHQARVDWAGSPIPLDMDLSPLLTNTASQTVMEMRGKRRGDRRQTWDEPSTQPRDFGNKLKDFSEGSGGMGILFTSNVNPY